MKVGYLILVGLASVAAAQQSVPRRDIQEILSTNVPHYTVKATNLLQAMAEIGSDFDLPIGAEWQGDPTVKKEIHREWNNVTVERILYDTASFDVEYQIQLSNGVVHLRKAELADSPRNPLNIRVHLFSVIDEYSRKAAFELRDQVSLIVVPRQKDAASACAGSYGVSSDETRITISMRDAPVRDILDALLVGSHSMLWLVTFRSEQPPMGFFKTKSIWRNTTELQQPDWDFLARYSDPISGSYRGDWERGIGR